MPYQKRIVGSLPISWNPRCQEFGVEVTWGENRQDRNTQTLTWMYNAHKRHSQQDSSTFPIAITVTPLFNGGSPHGVSDFLSPIPVPSALESPKHLDGTHITNSQRLYTQRHPKLPCFIIRLDKFILDFH